MDLKDTPYLDGARQVLSRLCRFTVLRYLARGPIVGALIRMLEALVYGDAYAAMEMYHVMSEALLSSDARRVSGDIFHDYLLYALLEEENAFSLRAAAQAWDEPLCAAMRTDLTHINALFALNSAVLKRWVGECFRDAKAKPRQQKDNIAVMSSAVWSGGMLRPLPAPGAAETPKETPRTPFAIDENAFVSWRYRPEPMEDIYPADSALEEIYRRLLQTGDRGLLLDDLWNFHASYGTGAFVRDRLFLVCKDGTLSAIRLTSEPDAYGLYQEQREREMKNAIRFMRGDHADNMLITGGPGTGKTMQVLALARELPEMRLIVCPAGRLDALEALIPRLLGQPFRFLVLLDDFNPADESWPELRARLAPTGAQPPQMLLAACTRAADDAFFPLKIQLHEPLLKEFIELVQVILLQRGKDVDFDSIQNACIDYAAAAGAGGGSPLSFRSAGLIAETLLAED